jgi:hypothetical protein
MLKVAGWIIPRDSVNAWRQAHPQLGQKHMAYSTRETAQNCEFTTAPHFGKAT